MTVVHDRGALVKRPRGDVAETSVIILQLQSSAAEGGGECRVEFQEHVAEGTIPKFEKGNIDDLWQGRRYAQIGAREGLVGIYEQRAAVLHKVAMLLEQHANEFVEWIVREAGAIRPRAEFELGLTVKVALESAAMPSQPLANDTDYGLSGGPAKWEEFSQWQWVTIKDKAPVYPF